MSSNTVSQNPMITLRDFVRLIVHTGHLISYRLVGEPGTAKSSTLKMIRAELGEDYEYAYIDCPTLGDGDLGMNVPDRETRLLEFMASRLLHTHSGKPVVVMLDEYLKVDKMAKKMFSRLILEHAIGDITLPAGSIVYCTSNLSGDGLGDTAQAHENNRVTEVELAKPTYKDLLPYAVNAGWSAVTLTLLQMQPRLLESYRSISARQLEENPYIFNPLKPQKSFVTPRSIEKADHILKMRKVLGWDLTLAALIGTVGAAAAELFAAFAQMEKGLLPIPEIIKNPLGVTSANHFVS